MSFSSHPPPPISPPISHWVHHCLFLSLHVPPLSPPVSSSLLSNFPCLIRALLFSVPSLFSDLCRLLPTALSLFACSVTLHQSPSILGQKQERGLFLLFVLSFSILRHNTTRLPVFYHSLYVKSSNLDHIFASNYAPT